MGLRASVATRAGVRGALKLARLLEAPESEIERRVKELEADPRFARLLSSGAVAVEPYRAGFASRRGGWGVSTATDGLGELLEPSLIALMRRVGAETFESVFLHAEAASDEARASEAGISLDEARRLRELVDRLYVREELETPSAAPAPEKTYSVVAGVDVEDGRPALGFFSREIWKGRYRVREAELLALKRSTGAPEWRRLESLVKQLEFVDRRKSTLYRALEELVKAQAEFLSTGEPSKRRPFTQRELASRLGVDAGSLNRLISNKAVRLPWGLEAPLKTLVPSAKTVLRDRLSELAQERPSDSDERLRCELHERFGARLSRRSVAQYRLEIGLAGAGRRVAVAAALVLALLAPRPSAAQVPIGASALDQLFDGAAVRQDAAVAVPGRSAPSDVSQPGRLLSSRPSLTAEQRRAMTAIEKGAAATEGAWPDHSLLAKPLLMVLSDGSALLSGWLLKDGPPPPEFRPVFEHKGKEIFYVAAKGPELNFSFRLNYPFGGKETTAVRAEKGFETPEELVELAAHERFHDFQDYFDEPPYSRYAVEEPEDVALANMENKALAWWLRSGSMDAMKDFAALRMVRRRRFPGSAAEEQQENSEGTARYVEMAARKALRGEKSVKELLLENLEKRAELNDMPKSRLYPVGATLSLFLEKREKGRWQPEIEKGKPLSALALAEIGLDPASADARVARVTRRADYAAELAAARESVAALKAQKADALERFKNLPGQRVDIRGLKNGHFSTWEWLDYADGTRIFDPLVRWVADGFEIKDMMALSAGEALTFVLPPGVLVETDARIVPGAAPAPFTTFKATGANVSIDLGPGTIQEQAGVLHVVLPKPAR